DRFSVYYNVLAPGSSTTDSPEHHPDNATGFEFGYILSGKLRIDIEDQVYILNPGDSICIDATKRHSSTTLGSAACEMLWFMIP
ncbi:MAG: cupin domain-containing protein, partial [Gracilibacteraceae bacterium]|nr:cupin domain-containing protein [Gracilibacteraceae bacterium]